MKKHDIENEADVLLLVESFYAKALKDKTIGYIFTEVAKINMDTHLPILCAFWNTVLFGKAGYKGNTIAKHIELTKKEPLTDAHFTQWKHLFFETLNELFEGEIAQLAKTKVDSMIFLMKFKIEKSQEKGFIQ